MLAPVLLDQRRVEGVHRHGLEHRAPRPRGVSLRSRGWSIAAVTSQLYVAGSLCYSDHGISADYVLGLDLG